MSRGEYRSIYVALYDGPEFQALPSDARWLLVTMRLTMGATGIAAVTAFTGVYAEHTGMDLDRVRAAAAELVAAGWVETERNVWWVVRALEFEPGLEVRDSKHRIHVRNHVASLPRLAIVTRFKARYAAWWEGAVPSALSTSSASEGPSMPLRSTQPEPETPLRQNPVGGSAVARVGYHVRCVVALNRAIQAHPDIGATGREIAASEMQGAVSWEADGIPVELVERVIRDSMTKYRPTDRNKQPSTLRYFDAAVRRAWELERQPKADTPLPPTGLKIRRITA